MAIQNQLGNFVIIGIKSLLAKSKLDGSVQAELTKLVNVSFSDSMSASYLRGGLGNEKILVVYGDREAKFTAETATLSPEILAIMTNNKLTVKTKQVQQIETLEVSGGKFTLSKDIVAGTAITVKAFSAYGKLKALTVGTPTSNQDQYSISGKVITCHTAVTKIKVYYMANEEVETIELADITPKTFEFVADCVCKEVESGNLYRCTMHIPMGSITPEYSIAGKNSSDVPDNSTITIDCMMSEEHGYPIAINFQQEAE